MSLCNRLEPLSSPQINLPPLLQIRHDLIDAPRLKFVPLRIVWWDALIIFHPDAFLKTLDNLLVILVREALRVVFPNPLGQAWRRLARIDFHLRPVGLLEKLGVGETDLLGARGAGKSISYVSDILRVGFLGFLPQCLMHVDCFFDVLLATNLETRCKRDSVFKCLCRTVT